MKHETPLIRALRWIGVDPTPLVTSRLGDYAAWLRREAVPAGGLGPGEDARIEQRHLADSLLFAGVWADPGSQPVLDVGSGVGLPGIPLAIVFPATRFRLIDRAGRRTRLAHRAVRVLGLDNVEVVRADIEDIDWTGSTVVSRAALAPSRLLGVVARRGPPGELLVAGSWKRRPHVPGFETVEIPAEILDQAVWILRMDRS